MEGESGGTPRVAINPVKRRRFHPPSRSQQIDDTALDTSRDNLPLLHDEQVKYQGLKETVKTKEEKLQKLKLVQSYKFRKNEEDLDTLIKKWTDVTQTAFLELHDKMTEPKPTLAELINHFRIDFKLVNFDAEEGDFVY